MTTEPCNCDQSLALEAENAKLRDALIQLKATVEQYPVGVDIAMALALAEVALGREGT
jgi:hypothetical protein